MTAQRTITPALRTRILALTAAVCAVLLLAGCGLQSNTPRTGSGADIAGPGGATGTAGATASGATAASAVPFDVTPLLDPGADKKYFGAALPGIPKSMSALATYTKDVGKQPNMVEYYASWGDGFDTSGARKIYDSGALPYMAWEPYKPSLAAIAKGSTDTYLTSVAKAVAAFNLPVAISFGHEMNGDWYAWGRQANSAADFVNAWRHIHDVFQAAGATNVIWVWSPNIINPAPTVKLQPYYPGDAYVDWVGMIGYYTLTGAHTFDTLYGPTMRQVRTFSKKPFLISETASQKGNRRLADVDDLFNGIQSHPDVIGFIWFDEVKRADWRIESTPGPLADFKTRASNPRYSFNIRKP